jgi:hypothetical protein
MMGLSTAEQYLIDLIKANDKGEGVSKQTLSDAALDADLSENEFNYEEYDSTIKSLKEKEIIVENEAKYFLKSKIYSN